MNTSNIPKTFWYSISFAIVFLSIGFIVIAFLSKSTTLKYGDLELVITQAASTTQMANEELLRKSNDLQHIYEKITKILEHSKPIDSNTKNAEGNINNLKDTTKTDVTMLTAETNQKLEQLKAELKDLEIDRTKDKVQESIQKIREAQARVQKWK
jgi:chromosome segregation ATPase